MSFKEIEKQGQSLIEVLFAMGVTVLLVTGVVVLATRTLGSKRRVLGRSEAVKIATEEMEALTILSENDRMGFWDGTSRPTSCVSAPPAGYSCIYGYNNSPASCPGAEICLEATVTVNWTDGDLKSVVLTKFFHED